MKRHTNLNLKAFPQRNDIPQPNGSAAPAPHAKPKHQDKIVVIDDRLMLYSKVRSISWAEERQMILKGVHKTLKPQNILEDHGCEVITDLIRQIRMLDRFRALVLERARDDAIINLLVGRLENAHGLVLAMLRGDDAARIVVEDALSTFGIPDEAIEAEAFMLTIDQIEPLNALSAQAQIRIDLQLKQIERRRPIIAAEIKALAHVSNEHDEEAGEARREAQEEDRAEAYRSACEDDEEGVF